MVTCHLCCKNFTKECTCFNGVKWLKEYYRLAGKEVDTIKSVRKHNKPLFIVAEATNIKKDAKITKLEHYGIQAEATFKGSELGDPSNFYIKLVNEDDELVYRRNFQEKTMTEDDRFTAQWKLETKTEFDKLAINFFRKFF